MRDAHCFPVVPDHFLHIALVIHQTLEFNPNFELTPKESN